AGQDGNALSWARRSGFGSRSGGLLGGVLIVETHTAPRMRASQISGLIHFFIPPSYSTRQSISGPFGQRNTPVLATFRTNSTGGWLHFLQSSALCASGQRLFLHSQKPDESVIGLPHFAQFMAISFAKR